MALDPAEFRKKRLVHQRKKAEKDKRNRKILLWVIIAACVAVVGLIVFLLIGAPKKEKAPSKKETQPVVQAEDLTVIHLAAAGDLNITDRVVAAGGADYDFTKTFMDIAHVLADADLTVVNLEGNLCGAPYGSKTVSAPQQLMEALASAGVDMVQLANSYSINRGVSGLIATINGVRSAGMEPLGVYADQASYKASHGYTICEIQGVRIAIVAFTKGMDGMALPPGSEHCVNVLYTDYESTYQKVDTQGITAVLQAAEREAPDITVAFLHWGSEFNNTISSSQEKIVSLMQENGVDAIIGTHSHYVQQMVLDETTGNFVAYSLGDFFGDAARAGSEYSVILDLEITKNKATGEAKITGYDYTPIFTISEKGSALRVVRIEAAMKAYDEGFLDRISQSVYSSMEYALQRIEARVTGE